MFTIGIINFLKRGNKSSGIAALGNLVLTVIKGIVAAISGSGAMFAEAVHSGADTINQGLVFFGSALSEKKPTKRFPTGFGRVVNLFVLVAVIVIAIMAYETILKGWELTIHPEASSSLWLMIGVLLVSVLTDGGVLIKTLKEINHEAGADRKGFGLVTGAFTNLRYAAPPTRLVFYEDLVATLGSLVAIAAIGLAHTTGQYYWDGIGTILIGLLLMGIALKTGYDNTVGLIGVAAPQLIEERVAKVILSDSDVDDIDKMRIVQEGRLYHVEVYVELRKEFTLNEADDVVFRLEEEVLKDPAIGDVTIGIFETDDVPEWGG